IFGQGAVESVITVGAVSADDPGNDTIEDFSSRGNSTIFTDFASQSDWVARESLDGVAIDQVHTKVGSFPQHYFADPFGGTSAAAPHVAGIAALMLQANPGLTPAAVEGNLQGSAVDLYGSDYDTNSGWGRFDALQAVYQVFTPSAPDLSAT